ncbi:MAG TPA: hypothetical protein VMF88_10495 [Bacteroidota bacterium]|nr:hypothetical protein [Bacteroidota bacterium]
MDKKTKIVWFCGGSGAGKECLIRKISEGKVPDLVKRLGWNSKKIIPCPESMDWVIQDEKDGNGERRKQLPKIIEQLAVSHNSVILVKGQDVDLTADRLEEVKHRTPQCDNMIIFIDTSIDETFERCRKKKWWSNSFTKNDLREWLKEEVNLLKKVQSEFLIVAIEGGSDKNYEFTAFPPTIK